MIIVRYECKKCDIIDSRFDKECSRCRTKNIKKLYEIYKCKNHKDRCDVNGWGCVIHRRSKSHGFLCVCDECM